MIYLLLVGVASGQTKKPAVEVIPRHAQILEALRKEEDGYPTEFTTNEKGEVISLSLFRDKIGFLKDEGLRHVAGLETLKSLDLTRNVSLTDKALLHLKSLKHLESLICYGNRMTGASLAELSQLTNLKHLSLASNDIQEEHLTALSSFPKLQTLSLYRTRVDDSAMKFVGQLKHLRVLDLSGTQITDDGLKQVAGLTAMERLILPCDATNDCLPLLAGMKRLKSLRIGQRVYPAKPQPAHFVGVTASSALKFFIDQQGRDLQETFETLGIWLRKDTVGNIYSVSLYDDDTSARIDGATLGFISRLPAIQTLDIRSKGISDKDFLSLHVPKTLTTLKISTPTLTRACVSHIGEMTGLQNVTLPSGVVEEQLDDLQGLRQLRRLTFHVPRLSQRGLQRLAQFPELRYLSVAGRVKVNGPALALLAKLRHLEELVLDNTSVGDHGLKSIGQIHTLKKLSLTGTRITDAGLGHLKDLKQMLQFDTAKTKVTRAARMHLFVDVQQRKPLDIIELEGGRLTRNKSGQVTRVFFNGHRPRGVISDHHLRLLKGLSTLEEVKLYKQPITGEGLVHLKDLPNLKRLNFYRCENIRDASVQHLSSITTLQQINFYGCKLLTDKIIPHLQHLRQLERLTMVRTSTTKAALQQLEKTLPNCKITYPRPK